MATYTSSDTQPETVTSPQADGHSHRHAPSHTHTHQAARLPGQRVAPEHLPYHSPTQHGWLTLREDHCSQDEQLWSPALLHVAPSHSAACTLVFREATWVSLAPPLLRPQLPRRQVPEGSQQLSPGVVTVLPWAFSGPQPRPDCLGSTPSSPTYYMSDLDLGQSTPTCLV